MSLLFSTPKPFRTYVLEVDLSRLDRTDLAQAGHAWWVCRFQTSAALGLIATSSEGMHTVARQ